MDLKALVNLNSGNLKVLEYLQIILRKTGDPEQNFKDKFFVPLLERMLYRNILNVSWGSLQGGRTLDNLPLDFF